MNTKQLSQLKIKSYVQNQTCRQSNEANVGEVITVYIKCRITAMVQADT